MAQATNTQLGEIMLTGDLAGNGGAQVGTNPQLKTIPGLVAGSYSIPNITIDAKGRVVAIANGGTDLISLLPSASEIRAGIVSIGDNLYIAGEDEAGYWMVNFGGTLAGTTNTGLSNSSCAQYSFDIAVDQYPKETIIINGSSAQTVTAMISALNAKMTTAVAGLVNGNIVIASKTQGNISSVTLSNVSLFACVTGYVSVGAGYLGTGSCQIYVKRGSDADYGVVKIGNGIDVDNGVISVDPNNYPIATATTKGVVSVPTAGHLVVAADGALSAPVATTSVPGVVQIGAGLTVNGSGVVAIDPNSLPVATTSTKGAVQVGAGLAVASGVLSVDTANLAMPDATTSVKGAIKVGAGLAVASGVLSVDTSTINLPVATTGTRGAVQVGAGLAVNGSGVLTQAAATGSTIGGVIVGSGLTVAAGVVSVAPATTSTIGGVKVGSGLAVAGDGTITATAIPDATTSSKGLVQVGSGLSVSSGLLSIANATTSTIGGVIVGSGLSVAAGVLSLAPATASTLGAVKVGTGLSVAGDGTISATAYPDATTSSKGIVQIGTGLAVTAGVVSVPPATQSSIGGVQVGDNIRTDGSGLIWVPLADGSSSGLITGVSGGLTLSAGVLGLSSAVVRSDQSNTFTGAQAYAIKDIGSVSTTMAVPVATGNNFKASTVTSNPGSVTVSVSGTPTVGQRLTLALTTGSALTNITWPTSWTIKGSDGIFANSTIIIDGCYFDDGGVGYKFFGTYTRSA